MHEIGEEFLFLVVELRLAYRWESCLHRSLLMGSAPLFFVFF